MGRIRLDVLVYESGLLPSREQAKRSIMAGEVKVDGHVVSRAGELVDASALIELAARPRFVSRGGEKLAGAIKEFGIGVSGLRALDVGASTGGFTDCLLQAGAAHVVALDVGYGQLAWVLRGDDRVTVLERTNIRQADPAALGAPFDIVVVDVSFISFKLVLPHLMQMLAQAGELVALVKPQFEIGKGRVGKRGVVRESAAHVEVLSGAVEDCVRAGLCVRGLAYSPIKGPEGNIEFWVWASRHGQPGEQTPEAVVAGAHEALGG